MEHSLSELAKPGIMLSSNANAPISHCTAGYFALYFESGSGLETYSPEHLARREVVCALFTHLSQFIIPANPQTPVNIRICDFNTLSSQIVSTDMTSIGSGYYVVPLAASAIGGIMDNQVWRTINAGRDAYSGLVSSLYASLADNGAPFYHGYMAFNFSNPGIVWHTDLSSAPPAGAYDLYSEALRQALHLLGFASLLNADGASFFGPQYPYYSRYDALLHAVQDSETLPLLTAQAGCTLYNTGFNALLSANSVLAPSENVPCSGRVRLEPSGQVVYTPSQFRKGFSLSLLSDSCRTPEAYPDGHYYVMTAGRGPGPAFMKRYPVPEERFVLCQLGYATHAEYGSEATGSHFIYDGSCAGLQVAGSNDGSRPDGSYAYVAQAGQPLAISDILSNDFNAVSFECLETIFGPGAPDVSSGVSFTFLAETPGLTLLRYVPVSASGAKGNIAYVMILVMGGGCPYETCNLVGDGGFETSTNCGIMTTNAVTNSCWLEFSSSPDIFQRNCQNPDDIPGPPGMAHTIYTIPTPLSNPAADTWPGPNNNHFLGLYSVFTTAQTNESVQTILQNPLVPGNTYTISFRARVANNFLQHFQGPQFGPAPPPHITLTIAGTANNTFLQPMGNLLALPANFILLAEVEIDSTNQWNFYTVSFTYNGTQGLNILILINSTNFINFMPGGPPQNRTYLYIDDVVLRPEPSATFNLPSHICHNQILPDLSTYVNQPGGQFIGPGVVLSNGVYSFNPVQTPGPPGPYVITYFYTDIFNCLQSLTDSIYVDPVFNISASASPQVFCPLPGTPVTLTASGPSFTYYTWLPPVNQTGSSITVFPTDTTTYSVVGTNFFGCSDTAHVTVVPANIFCCAPAGTVIPDGATSSAIGPLPSGTLVDVLGTFIIDNIYILQGCTLRMAPNARINVLSTKVLNLIECVLFACDTMWDGIYVYPDAHVILRHCIVEDAHNAIRSVAGGIYQISYTWFNKNYRSLYVEPHNVAHLGSVTGSTFTCETGVLTPGSLLKPPLAGQRSRFGIFCTDNHDIKWGDVLNDPNLFKLLEVGIFARNSRVRIYRNNFQQFSQPLVVTPPWQTPSVTGWPIWLQNCRAEIGDAGGPSHENNFTNCAHGILIEGNSAFSIVKNNFTNITTPGLIGQLIHSRCIYVRNSQQPSPALQRIVKENLFDGFETGLLYEKNLYGALKVESNIFKNFNTTGGAAVHLRQNEGHDSIRITRNYITRNQSFASVTGISVENAVATAYHPVHIDRNSINFVRHGIWCTRQGSLQVYDQEQNFYAAGGIPSGIYYPSPMPAQLAVGIRLEICPNARVINNRVVRNDTIPIDSLFRHRLIGIHLHLNCKASRIRNNKLYHVGRGLHFRGGGHNPLFITCNLMHHNNVGLTIDHVTGGVGPQGSPTQAHDNQWVLPYFATPPQWLGGQTLYIGTFLPPDNWYYRTMSWPFFVPGNFQSPYNLVMTQHLAGNTSYDCNFGCANPPCFPPGLARAMALKEPPYDSLDEEQRLMVDGLLYAWLRQDSSLTAPTNPDAPILIAFRDSVALTDLGRLHHFRESLAAGDTTGAAAALGAVTPHSCVEEYALTVGQIFLRSWAEGRFELEPDDSLALEAIAYQSPLLCGEAVIDARTMLGLDLSEEDENMPRKAGGPSPSEPAPPAEEDRRLTLYPNPVRGAVQYRLTPPVEAPLTLYLWDMQGLQAGVWRLPAGAREGLLRLEGLPPGIYSYKALAPDGSLVSKGRLIIASTQD